MKDASMRRVAGLVTLSVALLACPSTTSTPTPVDTSTVKQVVGPAGGTLVHPAGAKLVVPAGALSADVELSVTGAAAPNEATAGAPSVGQAFVLGPEGQQFARPLSIEVPVDPALVQQLDVSVAELRLRLAPQSTMAFVELATSADETRQVLSAQLTHFSIIVPVAGDNPFTFSASGLPAASVGVAYQGAVVVGGGTAPYTMAVVAGALPPGLAMSATGLLSGVPTQAGTFTFTVRVTDSAGAAMDGVVVMDVGGVGQCNTVPNSANSIAEQRVADTAPTPTGGPIAVGTWVRVGAVIHTGAGGATGPTGRQLQHTLRLTQVGGLLRFDSVYQEAGSAVEVVSGGATLSGTQLSVGFDCPAAATKVFGYSATPTSFTLFEQVSEGTRELLFVPDGTAFDGGLPGPDGGTTDGGATTDGGTTCTAPAANGAQVQEQFQSGTPPQAGGGTIADGEYELVSDDLFGSDAGAAGPTGNQRKQTILVTGTSASTTIIDSAGTQALQFNIAYAGPTMVLTPTCPASGSALTFAYTVTGSSLALMRGSSRGTTLATYQRTGGAPDGGSSTDGGVDVLGTGFTDLVDLAYDPAQPALYALGNGTVNRCDVTGCTGQGTVVTAVYASSIAVNDGTLYATTDFRNVKSCAVASCTLTQLIDVGANSYPAHLAVANNRLYWMSESGPSRRIQACPLAGCGAGPTAVYSGAELDGLAVSGVAVDASAVYVSVFTGGVWRIPLSNPDTASGPAVSLTGSAYGTGGLAVDGTTLGWAEASDNRVTTCVLPACVSTTTAITGLHTPVGLATDTTYVYGADRGAPNGSGGYLVGTARLWRFAK